MGWSGKASQGGPLLHGAQKEGRKEPQALCAMGVPVNYWAPCLLETALYGEQAGHRPAGPDCSQGKATETLEGHAGRSVLAGKGAFWKPRSWKHGVLLT